MGNKPQSLADEVRSRTPCTDDEDADGNWLQYNSAAIANALDAGVKCQAALVALLESLGVKSGAAPMFGEHPVDPQQSAVVLAEDALSEAGELPERDRLHAMLDMRRLTLRDGKAMGLTRKRLPGLKWFENGTTLTAGPSGGCSVNAVCEKCRHNYGCLPGYWGDDICPRGESAGHASLQDQ